MGKSQPGFLGSPRRSVSRSQTASLDKKRTRSAGSLDPDEEERILLERAARHEKQKLRDLFTNFLEQVALQHQVEKDAARIEKQKKDDEKRRKLKSVQRQQDSERERRRRELQRKQRQEEEEKKQLERQKQITDRIERAQRLQKEKRRSLLAKKKVQAERRAVIEKRRKQKLLQQERERAEETLQRQHLAEKKQLRLAERKKKALQARKQQLAVKDELKRLRVQEIRQENEEFFQARREETLHNLQNADKRRQVLEQARMKKTQLHAEIEAQKREKVIQKKHLIMQKEAEVARQKAQSKQLTIQDRLQALDQFHRHKSKALHTEYKTKLAQVRDNLAELSKEEEQYFESLQHQVEDKVNRVDSFVRQRDETRKRLLERHSKLKAQQHKFQEIMNRLTRNSSQVMKLINSGIDVDNIGMCFLVPHREVRFLVVSDEIMEKLIEQASELHKTNILRSNFKVSRSQRAVPAMSRSPERIERINNAELEG